MRTVEIINFRHDRIESNRIEPNRTESNRTKKLKKFEIQKNVLFTKMVIIFYLKCFSKKSAIYNVLRLLKTHKLTKKLSRFELF